MNDLKMLVAILLIATSGSAHADTSHASPPEEQVQAMSRLHHWVGHWQGSGWSMGGPGQRETFDITERVIEKLGGSALLIEGRGTSTGPNDQSVVSHEALGVVYYDSDAERYNFQTHDLRGRAHEVELRIDDGGLMHWEFQDEDSGALLQFEIQIEDERWRETGRISFDGGETWYPMLEMTLQRQSTTSERE